LEHAQPRTLHGRGWPIASMSCIEWAVPMLLNSKANQHLQLPTSRTPIICTCLHMPSSHILYHL